MKEISNYFKEKGVKNTLGGDIQPGSVQRMLNNRRYIGEYTFCDIIIPDGIPAIMPKESCSTECRKRWRKTEKPLPDIRQRTIIVLVC